MRRRTVVLGVVLPFLLAGSLYALDPNQPLQHYVYDVWEIESGLPQNSVLSIVQTRDGYLWLGTQEGIARFDGVRFTVFDRTNTPAIKNNHIQAMLEEPDGTLWIATYGGGLIRMRDGKFQTFGVPEGLPNDRVRALLLDSKKTLWVGTNGGLARFANERFTAYTTQDGLSANEVISIGEDVDGTLWVGTYGGGLNRFRNEKFKTLRVSDGLPSNNVWAIYEDRGRTLWIGTANGLCQVKNDTVTPVGLQNRVVHAIHEDRNRNLWIGTRDGLHRYRGDAFESFGTNEGLSHDLVRALFEDREGNLWIGTYGGGLSRLKNRTVLGLSKDDGLSEDVVRAIYEDGAGQLWIGTYGNGVNRYARGAITSFTTKDGLPHARVWSIYEDGNERLWFGTFGGGITRFDGSRFITLTTKEGLADDVVRCLFRDRRGTLWIGTEGGLSKLEGDVLKSFTTRDGLSDDGVIAIAEDDQGSLWLGTRKGLTRLAQGKFKSYSQKDGLSHDTVLAIFADRDGSLWFGTALGLTRLKKGKFTRYSSAQGLLNDSIFYIVDDDEGHLWMSSARGIFRVPRREFDELDAGRRTHLTSIAFGRHDGMRSSECNGGFQPAGWKTADGRIWFPTMRGIAVVDPKQIEVNRRPPPVILEEMLIDDVPVSSAASALRESARKVEFRYTALSFVAIEKVKFRYQLEGFDDGWIEAGTRRNAYYTSLPPGDYRFRVMACNNDGVWSEPISGSRFTIPPPFYHTPLFYTFFALALVLLGLVIYRSRTRHLRQREVHLMTLVRKHSEEIEHQKTQAEHLAYHDGLTGLPNRILFVDRLGFAIARAHRTGERFAVLFLDLDRFKNINDSLGHSVGDELLRAVAERIRSSVREGDTVARLGGDEFTLVLEKIESAEDAARIAQHLLASIRLPFAIAGQQLFTSTSIGIALYPEDGIEPDTLLKNADVAMYRAKEEGRDNAQLYTAALNARAVERLVLETTLRSALTQNELMIHYQPLVNLATGRVFGVEALLRWQHPEMGLLSPSLFISTAEASGLIVPIGEWVLRTACAQVRQWQRELGTDLRVAVNLSARQFQQPEIVSQVKAALEDSGLPPSHLELEITETNAMRHGEHTIRTMREIKRLGVRIAIDDFGTGYSSLGYLKQFPIDTIKLDQLFVRDLAHNSPDDAIAQAVITMAHGLALDVLAEGVETEEQLNTLRHHGCDAIQGYLFSVPLTPVEFVQFMRSAEATLRVHVAPRATHVEMTTDQRIEIARQTTEIE